MEWTDGRSGMLAPVGWSNFDNMGSVRAFALEVLHADPATNLRVVLRAGGRFGEFDVAEVRPSVATLMAWHAPAELPEPSKRWSVETQENCQHRRMEAASQLRVLLDELVESGEVSRSSAFQLLAALEAAMIRAASASAS